VAVLQCFSLQIMQSVSAEAPFHINSSAAAMIGKTLNFRMKADELVDCDRVFRCELNSITYLPQYVMKERSSMHKRSSALLTIAQPA
jgi:hypothetical protein